MKGLEKKVVAFILAVLFMLIVLILITRLLQVSAGKIDFNEIWDLSAGWKGEVSPEPVTTTTETTIPTTILSGDCNSLCAAEPEFDSGTCKKTITSSPNQISTSGSVYHVSPDGNDNNPGTSASPWKTITKAANTLSAGDTAYVHAGAYQEGEIKVARSGTETKPIVFMAYGYDQGNPDEVLITGAEKISSWTKSSGNIYYKNLGYATYQVFQNEEKLKFEPDGQNALGAGEWWLDKSSNILYVYAKDKGSGFNPSNYNMEVSKRSGGFVLDNREYIHVKGFQLCCFNPIIGDFIYEGVTYKIPRSAAVSISNAHNNVIEGNTIYNLVAYHSVPIIGGSYNRIENNKVFNVQGEAIKIWASRDDSLPSTYNIIKNNEVYNMEDYGGMESLFGGPKVLGWMYGNGISLGGDSGQYNEVSFNVVHNNRKGYGIWLDVGIQDTLIYSNIVFSNSRGIFVESRPKGTEVIKNIIYDNTFGIVVGGGPGLGPSYNGKFYNNVIYGNDRGMLILKARNNDFKNNLFFANVRGSVFVNTSDISTEALKTSLSGNTIDYNLYHSGDVSDIDNSDQFWWGKLQWVTEIKNADKTFEEFKSSSDQEKNSLNRNPQLVNSPIDFHLKSTSPAIDAGTTISLSLMEPPPYTGDAPDIGAFEFGLSEEGCLPDEKSIGQDGCGDGEVCCCSGQLPTPPSEHELGIYHAYGDTPIPSETKWIVAAWKGYNAPAEQTVILSDANEIGLPRPLRTAEDLENIESSLKDININKFWGIMFLSEEWWRTQIQFENGLNTDWFGQRLVGHNIYGGNIEAWRDEMYYRMLYGFYEHFKGQDLMVGHTMGMNTVFSENRDTYYGDKAWNYIVSESDFIFFYYYTKHLDHWNRNNAGKEYFEVVDEILEGGAKPFFILTQRWPDKPWWDDWEPEAIALEMKNALDRGMVIMLYRENPNWNPDFVTNWNYAKSSIDLYNQDAPYYEEYVEGKNLLTGFEGTTYGWVDTS